MVGELNGRGGSTVSQMEVKLSISAVENSWVNFPVLVPLRRGWHSDLLIVPGSVFILIEYEYDSASRRWLLYIGTGWDSRTIW